MSACSKTRIRRTCLLQLASRNLFVLPFCEEKKQLQLFFMTTPSQSWQSCSFTITEDQMTSVEPESAQDEGASKKTTEGLKTTCMLINTIKDVCVQQRHQAVSFSFTLRWETRCRSQTCAGYSSSSVQYDWPDTRRYTSSRIRYTLCCSAALLLSLHQETL